MNILDYIIIGIIGLSTLYGMYRGCIQSVISLGGAILSLIASFIMYPHVVNAISSNPSIIRTLLYYTDANSLIGDLDLAGRSIDLVDQATITTLLNKLQLAKPLDILLKQNIEFKVFRASNALNLSDYVSQTIINVSINILACILCYFAFFIVFSLLLNLVKAVFRLPVLSYVDWLAGGLMGFLRGGIFVFLIFTLLPLLQTVSPTDIIKDIVNQSMFAPIFQNNSFIIGIMNKHI